MFKEDTIAAVATGMGMAGIGIIRVSGNHSVEAVEGIFRGSFPLSEAESHKVLYGHIYDKDTAIDEVLVTVFRAPRSYTKEDVVEISSHGGSFVMRRILDLVLRQGVRLAEPGEFTKRAFLNGRIDLAQAESVMDIISSDNERSLQNSLKQLDGLLSEQICSLREEILQESAFIEAALDDPEHYELSGFSSLLEKKTNQWRLFLSNMIAQSKQGRIIRDGIHTVIVGKPNAGKSSLLNALAREERAIVTDRAGTTRDTIEEKVVFGEFVLALMDTAGIRNTEDVVEQIGVEKSYEALSSADLILYLVDTRSGLSTEDLMIVDKLDPEKTIVLFNKVDLLMQDAMSELEAGEEINSAFKKFRDEKNGCLSMHTNEQDRSMVGLDSDQRESSEFVSNECESNGIDPDDKYVLLNTMSEFLQSCEEYLIAHEKSLDLLNHGIFISAKRRVGFSDLEEEIRRRFEQGAVDNSVDILITNERHATLIREADVDISHVQKSIEDGMPEDFFTVDLMEAYEHLGAIIGEEVGDDLVDKVFREFCMGK